MDNAVFIYRNRSNDRFYDASVDRAAVEQCINDEIEAIEEAPKTTLH